MRFLLSTIIQFSCFLALSLQAQKEDNVWMLGGYYDSPDSAYKACMVEFENNLPVVTFINKELTYYLTNTIIGDSSGNLLCFSNGENLYNRNYEIIEGGENFYTNAVYLEGVPFIQSYLILPFPGHNNKVTYIYGSIKTVIPPSGAILGYVKLRYATADMSQNGGLGKVIQRDIIAGTDTLMPTQISAVRHGNGRDWWLIAPYYLGHKFYRYLLTPEGLHPAGEQDIPATDLGLGHTCFSPDGQWYARFNWHGIIPDSSFATIELYHFDRCSGLLSDRVSKTYDLSGLHGKPGGVAFSPSSRFLYVTRWDSIFQYDLHTSDVVASEKVVAVYDNFLGDLGLPTRFFYPLLAPDNKIYICVSNYNSPYLHTIESPDSSGLSCHVQQHSVRLPVFNNNLLPNIPYYRLWDWEGSPCDTLGSVAVDEPMETAKGFAIFPNPATQMVHVTFTQPIVSENRLTLMNMTGQMVWEEVLSPGTTSALIPVWPCPNGTYFIRLRDDLTPQKLIIIH